MGTSLERFTARAKETVVLAYDESRRLGHDSVGCEHLLLAIVHEPRGLAWRMFSSLGVTVERVRAQVVRTVGAPAELSSAEVRFTQEAKKALELSLHEPLSLGHRSVSSLHILLALLRQDEGLRARTLSLLEIEAAELARAAAKSAPDGWRSPSAAPAHIASFARIQIEKQAALKASDFERAAALESRSRMIAFVLPKGIEKRQDPVVARVRALLA